MSAPFSTTTIAFLLFCFTSILSAQEAPSSASYKLSSQDIILVTVFDEPELKTEVRISGLGRINLPLIGEISIAGKSLRETELFIASEYKRQEFLRKPAVSIFIQEYGPKEISVLGEVEKPGITQLPLEKNKISIVEAISRAGGFTRIAKSDAVKITRTLQSGKKEHFTVNVSELLSGKSQKSANQRPFMIQSGDVIFIAQRIF